MERQQSEKRGTAGARITNYGNDPKSIKQGSTVCDTRRVVERKRRPPLDSHLTDCDIDIIVMMTCDAWNLILSKPMKITRNCIKYSFLKAFGRTELYAMAWWRQETARTSSKPANHILGETAPKHISQEPWTREKSCPQ